MCAAAPCSHSDFSAEGNQGYQWVIFLQSQPWHTLVSSVLSWDRLNSVPRLCEAGEGCIREFFLVFPKLLGVEEGEKHKFFMVLKSGLHLAKNIVQNLAVELVVVCVSLLRWTSPCNWSACGAFRGLVDFPESAPLLLSSITKFLHPCQTKLYIQFFAL